MEETVEPQNDGGEVNRRRNTVIVVGLLGFLLIVFVSIYIASSRAELARVRASLTKSGERLRPTEIVTNLPPGVSDGILDLLSAATAMPDTFGYSLGHAYQQAGVRIVDSGIAILPAELRTGGGRVWVSNIWDEASPYVETNRHIWEIAAATLTNDVIRTHLDWSKGFSALSSGHLRDLKQLVAWSAMAVAYDLHQGDQDTAMATATDGFRILGKYQGDLTLIGQMTRNAMFTVLGMRTWLVLQHEGWSDDQLRELQAAISSAQLAGSMLRGLEMERAMVIQLWEQMVADPKVAMGTLGASGASPKTTLASVALRVWSVGPAHGDMSWYLERFQDELDLARASFSTKSYQHFGSVKSSRSTPSPAWWQLMSKMVWLDFTRTVQQVCQVETFREMQIAAIALRRHQMKHGHHPEKLDDLVPEFLPHSPVDWMDGRQLRYELLSDGSYKLWSVGHDLKDQGGDPSGWKKQDNHRMEDGLDWVWPSAATSAEMDSFIRPRRQKWLDSSHGVGAGMTP